MKNILFISYDGMTDPLGQSQVIPYLIGLSKFGFRFTILTCEKPEKFALYKKKIENILSEHPIKWVPIPYNKNPPILSALYDTMMLKRTARKLHAQDPFHMVHTRAGTPAIVGLWMKKKFGIKFLNDLRDFYADSRVDSGSWSLKNPVYRKVYHFFKQKEAEAIELSDGIVCLTHTAEKIIKKSSEYKKCIPINVIPCSVDMELFDPEKIDNQSKKGFAKKLGILEDDCIFTYLGSIKDWSIISFFKIILDNMPHAKLLFITPDLPKPILEKAEVLGINKNKIIITQAQRTEVPTLISLSKYSMFFIKPCYSIKAASPTKHGEIMAMGIPVITNYGIGDVADVIKKYNSGIVVKDFKKESFQKVAIELSKLVFNKESIRKGASEFYNLENAIHKYQQIYVEILN